MAEDALSILEEKIKLLVTQLQLLKKENLTLRKQVQESGGSEFPEKQVIVSKIKDIIRTIDTELEAS
ncbi:MAG: hypothetical protein K9N11_07500 [Lentisphaeria bacterium]|nr:hypothetical protein [Candidatus Neomarinimicrobiota bacterium]MCF7842681.1 hypothetical protein [Lentisphaeria bacterium]